MWKELLAIFSAPHAGSVSEIEREFGEMLAGVQSMSEIVRGKALDVTVTDDERARVYELDVGVNKSERQVRKLVLAHLSLQQGDISYCLLMMTLVKDVERIGDYLKNLAELSSYGATRIPEGTLRDELNELMELAHTMLDEVPDILDRSDTERASVLIRHAREAARRCDDLLVELSKSDLNAAETTAMVLATRFYKRVGGHLLNVLTSLVMPFHKVAYYDERFLGEAGDTQPGNAG
jgi:phosphate uptake regulator